MDRAKATTATRASDARLTVRWSGNERGTDDIVHDDATFLVKRAIFARESCCTPRLYNNNVAIFERTHV
jgi:hypothetical protein